MSIAQLEEVLYDEELVIDEPLIDVNFSESECTPWSEVYEDLCKSVGQYYGLNDIREAR